MSIISKESFEKLTKEEQESLRREYYYMKSASGQDSEFRRKEMEVIFAVEDLMPTPKTWEDVVKYYPASVTGVIGLESELKNVVGINDKVAKKLIATAKLAKLIELGYGGMITDEEWEDENKSKWVINCDLSKEENFEILEMFVDKSFIAFHDESQAEEFMFYLDNRELVDQYYMV